MNHLSDWMKLIQEQGEKSRLEEEKLNRILDNLANAMDSEDSSWWLAYCVPHMARSYVKYLQADDKEFHRDFARCLVDEKRRLVKEVVLPCIRAGIKSGEVRINDSVPKDNSEAGKSG